MKITMLMQRLQMEAPTPGAEWGMKYERVIKQLC